MKTAFLALVILCLTGCHIGSSKDASPADHANALTSASNKATEKLRDSMLDKNVTAQSETKVATPATAASTAAPKSTDDASGATGGTAIPSSAPDAKAAKTSH